MILGDVQVAGKHLECEKCHYRWISIAATLPDICRNLDCRSREWNGKKKRVRKPKTRIELPKPTKIKWKEEDDGF